VSSESQQGLPTAVDEKEDQTDSKTRSKRKQRADYLTEYACENSRLSINCTGGYIDVIRANYGRFSISVCNDHGHTEWSVNCMSPRTLRVIKARYVNDFLSSERNSIKVLEVKGTLPCLSFDSVHFQLILPLSRCIMVAASNTRSRRRGGRGRSSQAK